MEGRGMSRISGPDDGERTSSWNCCCGESVMLGGLLMTVLVTLAVRRKGKKR